MSTNEAPQLPTEYLVAARAGLKAAGMASQFSSIDVPPEIVGAIITAQAIDRQTRTLAAIGDELINAVKNVAGK